MNILVVDDDHTHAPYIEQYAKAIKPDITLRATTTRTEALNLLVSKEFLPDVIFVDLHVDYDQTTTPIFCHAIRNEPQFEHVKNCYIIVNSYLDKDHPPRSYGESPRMCLSMGANEYLQKLQPLKKDIESLTSKLKELIEKYQLVEE